MSLPSNNAIFNRYTSFATSIVIDHRRWKKALRVGDFVFPNDIGHEVAFNQIIMDGVFTEAQMEEMIDLLEFGWADPNFNFYPGGTLGFYS